MFKNNSEGKKWGDESTEEGGKKKKGWGQQEAEVGILWFLLKKEKRNGWAFNSAGVGLNLCSIERNSHQKPQEDIARN